MSFFQPSLPTELKFERSIKGTTIHPLLNSLLAIMAVFRDGLAPGWIDSERTDLLGGCWLTCLRGWGRSVTTPATQGLTGPSSVVLSDIHSFVTGIHSSIQKHVAESVKVLGQNSPPPIFLMGHSMGGAEVLYYMLNSPLFPTWIRGVLAYSPLIVLHPSSRPWNLTVRMGRLAAKVRPHHQLHKPLDPNLVCRDKRVCEEWKEDPLCHDTGTLEGMAGMLDRGEWLDALRSSSDTERSTDTALWVCHGDADQINSFEASQLFTQAVGVRNKTFKSYEGGFHKLHAEPNGMKEAFAKDVAEWILGQCDREHHHGDGEGPGKPRL